MQAAWQDWIADFPERPNLVTDPYLYARHLARVCDADLPPLDGLDDQSRIIVTSLLQNASIDLLRIQLSSSSNAAPIAIAIALANFAALLNSQFLPYVLIAEVLVGLMLLGHEHRLKELKRAAHAAQSKVDALLTSLSGGTG